MNYGDEKVGKLYFGKDEISGGGQMLESGTILYISGQDVSSFNSELNKPLSTAEIVLTSAGKHWEKINQIKVFNKPSSGSINSGQLFDINMIDNPTLTDDGALTLFRERNPEDTDKLVIKMSKNNYHDLVMVVVA